MNTQIAESLCRTIDYVDAETRAGSRVGGSSPGNATPVFQADDLKYFATVEFEKGLSISIFYSLDPFGVNKGKDLIDHNNQVLPSSSLIQAVVHLTDDPASLSGKGVASGLRSHQLVLGENRNDESEEDATVPSSHTKVGGRPYVDNESIAGPAFYELASLGYRQLLQFDTPNPVDFPNMGDFPWDPGWLHVFMKGDSLQAGDFAFVVQQ